MLLSAEPKTSRHVAQLSRGLWLCLAYGCLGIGAAGVVVPLLPTTPFLLLALYAGGRSSPRLRWRLLRHPRYGPPLRAWQRHGAIPVRAKTVGCALIATSWMTLWLMGSPSALMLGVSLLFLAVLSFILTRPSTNPAAGTCQ